ncbi:AAA family ATPase [Candidatus Pacearchaeota archaeon]|nr:AAA family ATPase [Candidatus Pacearchaeota archaeon]
MKSNTVKVFMMVGVPGCGKSYFVEKNGEHLFGDHIAVNLDTYRQEFLKDTDTCNPSFDLQEWRKDNKQMVEELAICRIKESIIHKKTIVLDNMNLNSKRRISDIKAMRDFASVFNISLFVTCFYFENTVTINRILKRSEGAMNFVTREILNECVEKLDPVTWKDEGFDVVLNVGA